MNPDLLHTGYKQILETIYSPSRYYERVRTFLASYNKASIVRYPFDWQHIAAFFRSMYRLGLLAQGTLGVLEASDLDPGAEAEAIPRGRHIGDLWLSLSSGLSSLPGQLGRGSVVGQKQRGRTCRARPLSLREVSTDADKAKDDARVAGRRNVDDGPKDGVLDLLVVAIPCRGQHAPCQIVLQ